VSGTDWKLSVADNGMGKPDGVFAQPKSGLGTGIVNALAKQLDSQVVTSSGPKGTTVSITHATFAGREERLEAVNWYRSLQRKTPAVFHRYSQSLITRTPTSSQRSSAAGYQSSVEAQNHHCSKGSDTDDVRLDIISEQHELYWSERSVGKAHLANIIALPVALVGGWEFGNAPASRFQGSGMDHFIHRENLAHYQRLLAEPNVTDDPIRHERINQLLAKEIAKGATAPRILSEQRER
jgi:hypothetical protein